MTPPTTPPPIELNNVSTNLNNSILLNEENQLNSTAVDVTIWKHEDQQQQNHKNPMKTFLNKILLIRNFDDDNCDKDDDENSGRRRRHRAEEEEEEVNTREFKTKHLLNEKVLHGVNAILTLPKIQLKNFKLFFLAIKQQPQQSQSETSVTTIDKGGNDGDGGVGGEIEEEQHEHPIPSNNIQFNDDDSLSIYDKIEKEKIKWKFLLNGPKYFINRIGKYGIDTIGLGPLYGSDYHHYHHHS